MDGAVARAEKPGVEMVMENIEDRDLFIWVALIRIYDSPALKVSIDAGHAYCSHGIDNAPTVDRHVRAAGDLLTHPASTPRGDEGDDPGDVAGHGSAQANPIASAPKKLSGLPEIHIGVPNNPKRR